MRDVRSTRAAPDRREQAAQEIAARAGEMGLAGPLGPTQRDRWRDGQPSEAAERKVAELRAASRARVLEASDVRRTSTALRWFADFTADTERVPFVHPSLEGGVQYNVETLAMFAEYIRRGGSKQKSRAGATLRADTIGAYVGAVRLLRSREA
eukprot:781650-Pleurochrysis_carterae.AAC.1